ncbi:MAG: class I SAM-dependent rRNA methyltransferase [Bacteroidales bacterium]|nr:class I SAM-dependent rRNA methyltransferase [Bacteroidales bacterium]
MKKVAAVSAGQVKIVLKSGKDQSMMRFHPWIFSGAIKKVYGDPVEGDVVEVYDNKENFLGAGHFSPGSIAVRILSFRSRDVGYDFFRDTIGKAVAYRRSLGFNGEGETTMYRLIHGEGDGLPGLIADYYDGVVVLQFHSVGMYRMRDVISQLIADALGSRIKAIYNKSENTLPHNSGITSVNGYIYGSAETPVTVMENGYKFDIDWVAGQKTGFFIDQRENRKLASEYSSGRKVLNLFGYTGGFSVYAMKNALLVDSVDSSAAASEMARRNVEKNFGEKAAHEVFSTDAFAHLDSSKERYDMMILDPPAFAKHNNVLGNALQGYKRLNMKAIENILPGGIIFTFSCSQVVSRENFRKSVFAAAANTGRSVRILHQMGQPTDHPVNIYHPESEYLKGLVLFVE